MNLKKVEDPPGPLSMSTSFLVNEMQTSVPEKIAPHPRRVATKKGKRFVPSSGMKITFLKRFLSQFH
jgi:hypothetical protein